MKSRQKRYFLDPHTGIYRMSGLETEPLKTIQRAEIAAEFSRNHYVECTVYDEMGGERDGLPAMPWSMRRFMGLMHQEFVMYLQPVIEMESGSITGAEALVRCRIREEAFCSPAISWMLLSGSS